MREERENVIESENDREKFHFFFPENQDTSGGRYSSYFAAMRMPEVQRGELRSWIQSMIVRREHWNAEIA